MNLYQKLIEIRKTVPYLQKESNGPQYKYVSSSQVLSNIRAKMDELNVLLIPNVIDKTLHQSSIENVDPRTGIVKRTTTYFTELNMCYTWMDADDPTQKMECVWYGQGIDIAGEKGVGKALTYAEKYFMLKFFNIATDTDDPDAHQEKHDTREQRKESRETKKEQKKEVLTDGPPWEDAPQEVIDIFSTEKENNAKITDAQAKRLFAIAYSVGLNSSKIKEIMESTTNKSSTKELTQVEYRNLVDKFESMKK